MRIPKMSQKLWVAHATTAKTFIDKVSIDGCEDIAITRQTLPSLTINTRMGKRLNLKLETLLLTNWKEILMEILPS